MPGGPIRILCPSGTVEITLDGSGSSQGDSAIDTYEWFVDGSSIGNGQTLAHVLHQADLCYRTSGDRYKWLHNSAETTVNVENQLQIYG